MTTFSPAQLEERRQYINASEVASLFGCGFKTRSELYLEKVHETEPTKQNDAMALGHAVEPLALERAAERFDLDITPNFENKTRGILAATPDGVVVGHPIGFEAKAVGPRSAAEWGDGADEIPTGYILQTNTQALVWGFEEVIVTVCFLAEQRFAHYRFDANPELGRVIAETAEGFWRDHVIPRVVPLDDELPRLDVLKRVKAVPGRVTRIPKWAAEMKLAADEAVSAATKAKKAADALVLSIDPEAEILDYGDGERCITNFARKRAGYWVQPGESRTLRTQKIKPSFGLGSEMQ